jgi:hypothetical protein
LTGTFPTELGKMSALMILYVKHPFSRRPYFSQLQAPD